MVLRSWKDKDIPDWVMWLSLISTPLWGPVYMLYLIIHGEDDA